MTEVVLDTAEMMIEVVLINSRPFYAAMIVALADTVEMEAVILQIQRARGILHDMLKNITKRHRVRARAGNQ